MIRKPRRQNGQRTNELTFEKLEPRAMLAATIGTPIDSLSIGNNEYRMETESVGRLFYDADQNGHRSSNEHWLRNWVVFGDNNDNQMLDADELACSPKVVPCDMRVY